MLLNTAHHSACRSLLPPLAYQSEFVRSVTSARTSFRISSRHPGTFWGCQPLLLLPGSSPIAYFFFFFEFILLFDRALLLHLCSGLQPDLFGGFTLCFGAIYNIVRNPLSTEANWCFWFLFNISFWIQLHFTFALKKIVNRVTKCTAVFGLNWPLCGSQKAGKKTVYHASLITKERDNVSHTLIASCLSLLL